MEPYQSLFSVIPLALCTTLYAQQLPLITDDSHYQPPITIISDIDRYRVNPDYSYQETETRVMQINSQVGVKRFSQIPLSYNPDLEKVQVIKAYTTKPDGKQIEVKQSAILDRQSAASADAPMFNNDRVKTVIFSDTAVGDTITLEIQKDAKPLFPKSFSVSSIMPPIYDVKHAEVQIEMPDTLNLYTDAPGMQAQPVQDKDGHKIWHWQLENRSGIKPEPGIAFTPKTTAAVFATTFKNEQAGADAYLTRAQDKAAVSAAVRKQADSITAGITDKKAQAVAIYNWVSENIRYVAVYFGAGGVVPHSADEILSNRYGDCKDHVTLLQALLAAKGIESQPVLVNSSNYYGVPQVAVMPGVFNHAITYLPEFKIYLDSTAEVAAFGVLPPGEAGKSALRVGKDAGIVTLPLSNPENDSVTAEINITLNADGTAKGSSKISQQGFPDWLVRMIAERIPHGMENQVAQHYLQITGQSGTGSYQFGKPRILSQPFTYQSDFALRDVFDADTQEGALRLPLGIGALDGITQNAFGALTSVSSRKQPFVLNGSSVKAVTRLRLPQNLTLNKLPQDVSFNNDLGQYQSRYSRDGQDITITRVLTVKQKAPVTPAALYPQLQALNDAVNKDLRRQVLYSRK